VSSLTGRAKTPCAAAANLAIEVFNSGERTVRHLFEWMASRASDQLPTKDDEVAHFVIVGFGEFGQSLAVSLAELGHFPNCKRLRMTIVDRDIESKKRVFLARYPRFTHPEGVEPQDCWHHGTSGGIEYVCNATFESVDDVGDPEFVTRLDRRLGRKGVKPLVFVCFDNESINFKQAERLRRMRDRLGDRFDAAGREIGSPRVKQDRWRILVWIPAQRELSDLLESSTPQGAASQRAGCPDPVPFGHCFGAVSYHEVTNSWSDRLAMILKYGYEGCDGTRATPSTGAEPADGWPDLARLVSGLPCRSLPPEKSSLTWEDHVNRARAIWRESPEAYRASDRSAAIHAVVKMAALGFAIHGRHAAPNQDADRAKERVREIVNKVKIFKDIKIDWDRGIKPSVSNQAAQQPVANLEKLPVMEHYRWCAERLLAGWSYAAQPPTKEMERDVKNRQFKHWNLVTADALHTLPGNSGTDDATTSDVVTLDYAPVHILLALAADGRLFDIGWISAGTGGADAVGNA